MRKYNTIVVVIVIVVIVVGYYYYYKPIVKTISSFSRLPYNRLFPFHLHNNNKHSKDLYYCCLKVV